MDCSQGGRAFSSSGGPTGASSGLFLGHSQVSDARGELRHSVVGVHVLPLQAHRD